MNVTDASWELSMRNARKYLGKVKTMSYTVTLITLTHDTDQRFELVKDYEAEDAADALGQAYVDMYRSGLEDYVSVQHTGISLNADL